MPLNILDLNHELLTCIAGHLSVKDLHTFSTVCHKFAYIAHSDAVWKEMLRNTFQVTYKLPGETWKEQFARKHADPQNNRICPHVGWVTGRTLEPYIPLYDNVMNRAPPQHNCSTCAQNHYDAGLCLYIWQGNTRIRCKECAYKFHAMAPKRFGILLRIPVLQMYCFACSRLLGETRGDPSEAHYVDLLLETLTRNSSWGRKSLLEKRQCMRERELYNNEADRASVLNDKFYFVDRMWICSWFLRLCDGKIGAGPIPNHHLELKETGEMNPDARPRSSFTGGFSIVTPHLWNYLVETYGLDGKAYCSDDVKGPQYNDLWQAIHDWKLI